MHVVDVTMFFGRTSGGVKRYLTAKHAWFAPRPGDRHTLLVPGVATRGVASDGIVHLQSLPLPFSNGYRWPLPGRHAVDQLLALAPDIIETGDPYTLAWSALGAGRELKVPVVGFYHSDLPRVIGMRFGTQGRRIAESYIRNLYSRFDLVLAPSQAMVGELHRLGIVTARQQRLGVDVDAFRPALRPLDVRSRLGLPGSTRLLAYAGRFAREKNLPWLFDAMRRLGRDYHLLAIGGGRDYLAPPDNVTLLPYLSSGSRLACVLGACDAFVHAGDKETFGLAVLEAMACGLPVVGMATGGVAELVPAGTGVLVPPAGGAAIADGVDSLFRFDLPAMGALARRHVVDHYSWDSVFPQLLARYAALRRPFDVGADQPLRLAHVAE